MPTTYLSYFSSSLSSSFANSSFSSTTLFCVEFVISNLSFRASSSQTASSFSLWNVEMIELEIDDIDIWFNCSNDYDANFEVVVVVVDAITLEK